MKDDEAAGKAAVGKRLKQALAALGLPMTVLSERSGLIYSSIQNYVAGKQMPGGDALTKIKDATGINIDWLLTGEGEILTQVGHIPSRNLSLDDYADLRDKYINFDDVFTFRKPQRLADGIMRSKANTNTGALLRVLSQFQERWPEETARRIGDKDIFTLSYPELLGIVKLILDVVQHDKN